MSNENRHHIVALRQPQGSYACLSSNPVKDVAIVFVHGFGGDAVTTWLLFQLLADRFPDNFPDWRRYDLFFYEYNSTNSTTPIEVHAGRLFEFLKGIFPRPALNLLGDPSPELRRMVRAHLSVDLPETQPVYSVHAAEEYRQLILVGHSLGAVLLRQVIADKVLDHLNSGLSVSGATDANSLPPGYEVLNADLALFAPVSFGALPTGLLGILYSVALNTHLLRRVFEPLVSSAPVLRDLRTDSPLLKNIQAITEDAARRCPTLRALRARILHGEEERAIRLGRYNCDLSVEYVKEHDHTSVCKPNEAYLKPLEFVTYGICARAVAPSC